MVIPTCPQKNQHSSGVENETDIIRPARRPGKWLIHCHIPHHTENDNLEEHGGGGLMMIIDVAER